MTHGEELWRVALSSSVTLIASGPEPAGRLIVARWPEDLRVVDVALLPEYRGRGIGGELMRALIEEADERGVKTSIHVERFNPAQRLYARLGFRAVSDDGGVYLLLERAPRPASQAKTAS